MLYICIGVMPVLEQQGDAPQTGQCYQTVDDAAEESGLTAAQPSHQIELEQTDQAQLRAPTMTRNRAAISIVQPPYCLDMA